MLVHYWKNLLQADKRKYKQLQNKLKLDEMENMFHCILFSSYRPYSSTLKSGKHIPKLIFICRAEFNCLKEYKAVNQAINTFKEKAD